MTLLLISTGEDGTGSVRPPKKVQIGRIDAFIAYVPDAYNAFRGLGIAPLPHDVAHPVAVHLDSLVCRNVQPEFIEQFNKLLKELRDSGRLKSILGNDYIAGDG